MQSPNEPVGAGWRKSRRSLSNGECVEVAMFGDGRIGIRDSKNRTAGTVFVSSDDFQRLLTDIKRGNTFPSSNKV
ncbi:DUF397 domain-containing protein [Actinomadura luzonensis]|nr:DUF397 domain-containing protein [Actinomadura luzonensis]